MSVPKRIGVTIQERTESPAGGPTGWSEEALADLEARYPKGMTVQQIVDAFVARGERLSEATFRKYVQLGLLPRSVRVGRKGKHRGSQGLYPVGAVRQLVRIRRLMADGMTIEEIRRELLFLQGELDELRRQIERIETLVSHALQERRAEGRPVPLAEERLRQAQDQGRGLLRSLEDIERQLTMQARMVRAKV